MWVQIFIPIWVWNLPWFPFTFVSWVIDHWWLPLSSVLWIEYHLWRPGSTTSLKTNWIFNSWRYPFTIFFIIPTYRFHSVGVWNLFRLALIPLCWFDISFIYNFLRFILVPIIRL